MRQAGVPGNNPLAEAIGFFKKPPAANLILA
jgi:hypothetical protein